jgi:uncharacterized protein (DUF433 family)
VANTFDRITQNPNVLAGRATIRGLRISVAHVVNLVANGMTPAQIVADLPDLEEEEDVSGRHSRTQPRSPKTRSTRFFARERCASWPMHGSRFAPSSFYDSSVMVRCTMVSMIYDDRWLPRAIEFERLSPRMVPVASLRRSNGLS